MPTQLVKQFESRDEILDYAFNGNDPWIQAMVRHCIEKDGINLNISRVNKYIREEFQSMEDGYNEWLNETA
tara:strand:- start:84 stop:296 length:213 start_codon:yes stop_codon:yes gene_type:complete